MIAPPNRVQSTPRGPAGARTTGATGSNGGDADIPAARQALDARITALVARPKTPVDEAIEQQREAFDSIVQARAELDREASVLRELALEQVKTDNEILKKWIAMI